MARQCLLFAIPLLGYLLIPPKPGEVPPRAEPGTPVLNLCLEIQALRILYLLHITPEQAKKLQSLSKELATPDRDREKPRVSDEYRRVLINLREALARDNEEKVEQLEDRLSELTESESPELDDAVSVTAAARRRVAEALRLLRPQQLASYLGAAAEEIGDPQERLVEALEQIRSDKIDDPETLRDELADDLGWLLGGLDLNRASAVREEVTTLLDKSRKMTDDAFAKQKAKLQKQARGIGASVASTEVLQHAIERSLARLLSNPRLEEALQGRLK